MDNTKVQVYSIINFVLAGMALIGLLCLGMVLVYGVFFSGDPRDEIIAGVMGCIVLSLPLLVAGIVYLLAGFGLFKRRVWGYYLHIAAAILTGFLCVGLIYTVVALIHSFKPEFKNAFIQEQPSIG